MVNLNEVEATGRVQDGLLSQRYLYFGKPLEERYEGNYITTNTH